MGEPVYRHMDDIDWTPVQSQRNADGSESVVRERWPIIRPDFLSAYVHYESGMVVRRHGHRSNHVVYVIDGGAWIGGEWSPPGTHIHVPLGATFGPIVAGPDGVTCWETSFGEFGGWGDEPESYEREIAARGVVPLPDPPLDIGEWFVDPRGDTGEVRGTPRVPGLAEVIVHVDEIGANGIERRAIDLPEFTSAYVTLAPGQSVERSAPDAHRLVFVLEGSASFDDRPCDADTHIEFPVGTDGGTITAGDDGVAFLELTDRHPATAPPEG